MAVDCRWWALSEYGSWALANGHKRKTRAVSSTSVAKDIRRGNLKISWPIPPKDDDDAPLSPRDVAPARPTSEAGRAPHQSSRHGSHSTTTILERGGGDGDSPPRRISTDHPNRSAEFSSAMRSGEKLPRSHASTLKKIQGNQNPRVGQLRKSQTDQPRKRGSTVKSLIKRLLRRSTVKHERVSQPVCATCGESGCTRHSQRDTRGTDSKLRVHGSLRETRQSVVVPSKELGSVPSRTSPSHTATDLLRRPTDNESQHDYAVEDDSPTPWQPTSPSSHADDDTSRPWVPRSPSQRWIFSPDKPPSTPWTGLAPRPASGHARRASSLSPHSRPADLGIGIALSHGGSPRRRSRSAAELRMQSIHRAARAHPDRRMSEEIKYWRESLSAQPLSPLSNERTNPDAEMSGDGSYADATYEMGQEYAPESRFSADTEVRKSTEIVNLRTRVAELEAKVMLLETAMTSVKDHLVSLHRGNGGDGELGMRRPSRDSQALLAGSLTDRTSGSRVAQSILNKRDHLYDLANLHPPRESLNRRRSSAPSTVRRFLEGHDSMALPDRTGSAVLLAGPDSRPVSISTSITATGQHWSDRPQSAIVGDVAGDEAAELPLELFPEQPTRPSRAPIPFTRLDTSDTFQEGLSPNASAEDDGYTTSEPYITPTEDKAFDFSEEGEGERSHEADDDDDDVHHLQSEDTTWHTNSSGVDEPSAVTRIPSKPQPRRAERTLSLSQLTQRREVAPVATAI